jgi:hypothetical protein
LLLLYYRLPLRGLSASRLLLHYRLPLCRLLLLHDLTLTRLRSLLFLLHLRLSRHPLLSALDSLLLLLLENGLRRFSLWRGLFTLWLLTHLLLLLLLTHLLLLRRGGSLLLTLSFALLVQLLLLSLLGGLLSRRPGCLRLSLGFALLFQLLLLLSLLSSLLVRGAGRLSLCFSLLLHLLPQLLLLCWLLRGAGLRGPFSERPGRSLIAHKLFHFAASRLVALFGPGCELAHLLGLHHRLRQTISPLRSRHLGRISDLQLVPPLLFRDRVYAKLLCEVSARRQGARGRAGDHGGVQR